MTALRNVARELVEKRLWPVAALLLVALIAMPVLFLRPAPAALDGSATTTGVPATAAAPIAGAAATGTTSATDVLADPSVAMTSSPFAAAFGSGLSLPPSMQGLLKATTGADETKAVRAAALRDPFAVAASVSASTATTAAAPAPATASTPPASTAATASTTGSSPAGATNPLANLANGNSTGSSTPAAGTTPVPDTTTPSTRTTTAKAAATGVTFHADVQFGTTGDSSPLSSDTPRLTAFPTSYDPVAVYLGVMRGGWGAAFALREDVRPVGAPPCRPRKQICSWVILHVGESVTLTAKDATTGATTTNTLKLVRISREDLAADEAKAANGRADVNGRCLLGPLAAYKYDTQTGTLAARPELKACQYRAPGQPETASVRTAHIG
jgi:hypothetical protein